MLTAPSAPPLARCAPPQHAAFHRPLAGFEPARVCSRPGVDRADDNQRAELAADAQRSGKIRRTAVKTTRNRDFMCIPADFETYLPHIAADGHIPRVACDLGK